MHPEGSFEATILDHGFAKSQKKGTAQFWTKFQTTEGTITGYFAFSPKAAEYTIDKIRAMGFQGNDLDELQDGTVLRNCMCEVSIKHEEYNGKVSAKVNYVNPPGGGVQRDEDAVESARSFNNLLLSTPPIMPTVNAAKPANEPVNEKEKDEYPF